MDLSLEQRLLRFLDREEHDEQRSAVQLRALPIEERVLEGECIASARFVRDEGDRLVFVAEENLSKFRAGDPLSIGDGYDFDTAFAATYRGWDAEHHELVVDRDRYRRSDECELAIGTSYCIDRRSLGLRGRLHDVVRAAFADEHIAAVLTGRHVPGRDEGRHERALAALGATSLNEAQQRAGAVAIATTSLALVQGPPGTGKTRLVAEVVRALCGRGARVALTGFTHRAVDNALLALRSIDARVELVKLGSSRDEGALRSAGIRTVAPRGARLAGAGVMAGTCFAFERVAESERFHVTVCDEAGQMPIPHALSGMLRARHWLFFGDHRQLPPVITAHHADREVCESIFERLHRLYGGELLDVTYRMNAQVCDVVSRTFYGGLLRAAPTARDRRMPFRPGGKLDEVLDPERSVVIARVDHAQPGQRSPEEAALCADLAADLLRQHGLDPAEIAIIAPFRSQVRLCRSAVQRLSLPVDRMTIDTVERVQGQEREVVIVSLAVGDPATLDERAAFFFSTNRINVALSRARCKAIVVASAGAFRALPRDPHALRAAAVFKSLAATLPQIDLTAVYGRRIASEV